MVKTGASELVRAPATFAGQATAALLVVSAALAAIAYRQVAALHDEAVARAERETERSLRLADRVSFDSRRDALVTRIGEEMRAAHPEVPEGAERRLAILVVEAAEKYPRVDPLLLASVGIVDSRGALDVEELPQASLYRPHPEAARELADELGWDYDDDLRADPARTAELAARYLHVLNQAYNDVEMVLAEYNGGPLDAGYLRAQVGRLSAETRSFVPEVLDVYRRLAAHFDRDRPSAFEVRRARTLGDVAGGGL